ncbi:hypothetical protein PG996_011974 [Apiospora saccharicola]|uniref:Uncharacterized protein n=1 Tax=Apiospora saccharicola TaxID=335842 RepID=A0ABR1U1J0_9PEZI
MPTGPIQEAVAPTQASPEWTISAIVSLIQLIAFVIFSLIGFMINIPLATSASLECGALS